MSRTAVAPSPTAEATRLDRAQGGIPGREHAGQAALQEQGARPSGQPQGPAVAQEIAAGQEESVNRALSQIATPLTRA
jgi:hypothetical protein